ncbi:MAG: tetratricopeptide repeat protein [Paludibacteraceae bacterium]|nr:tetratricopeptide repeat protein [Paludibacteraceae bacterium]
MKHWQISLCLLFALLPNVWGNEVEEHYAEVKQAYINREKNAQNDLKQYLRDYPYTTYYSSVQNMIGVLQVEKLRYKNAVKTFDKVQWKQLERQEQPVFFFYRGIAYLKQNMFKEASSCFKALREKDSPYALQGKFYYAYCWYLQEEYDKALPDLLSLETTSEYKEIAPYLVAQIYYAQHNEELAATRARQLLAQYPNNKHNGEMERILGEIDYNAGRYEEAAERLTRYEQSFREQEREVLREDIFLLGMAQYKLEQYKTAVTNFKRIKLQQDSLSEKVCLNLGHAYVKLEDIEKAKLSYQAAMRYKINPQVREEAMYNYALCTYKKGTALGESINAFNDFLKEYPNTSHAESVYELLAAMYMTSKNYAAALDAVCAIKNPNSKLQETKQFLRYQLGADALLQGKNQEVISWMSEVIQNASSASNYKTEAYFYRAEARYRLKQYEAAMTDLINYRQQKSFQQSPNRVMADYLQGYVSFNLKKYTPAQGCFECFVANDEAKGNKVVYADALNRIGDCQFNSRQFAAAADTYQRVIDFGKQGADYAIFQRGYVLGLMRQYTDKVNMMEQLLKTYPKSDYADDALYEIARAHLQKDESMAAIDAYSRLVTAYPTSSFARIASLERGMIYRNMGQYEDAVRAFRQTISDYPATEQAYSALDAMEQICVEQNRVSDYLAYTQELPKLNMSVSSKEDSLTYVAGEMQYMLGKYKEAAAAMDAYLAHYCPGGRHCLAATYNAADCYYRLQDEDKALSLYLALTKFDNNPYEAETYTRIAEIAFDKQDYAQARIYFEKMTSIGLKQKDLAAAKLGVLRSSALLNDYPSVIAIASDILSDNDISAEVRREALYNRAKAYVCQAQYGLAVADLTVLAKDVRVAEGAEAKYLLAQVYFNQGNLEDSESEIMSFAGMNTQHQYWLAKSLILLSDINLAKSDAFQAKQYLLTLQQNYKGQDDIQSIVSAKLQQIELSEQPQIETEEEEL